MATDFEKDKERLVAYEHPHIAHLNIFRPVTRIREKGVEIKGSVGDVQISVKMWHQLSNEDEDLLLLMYSMARHVNHIKVRNADKAAGGDVLTNQFINNPNAFKKLNTIQFTSTRYAILKALDKKKSSKAYKNLENALDRLSSTSLKYENSQGVGTTGLLGWSMDKKTKKITIGINPLSAMIILHDNIPYVRYNLEDRFDLPSGVTRRIHGVFSSLLNCGKGSINVIKLAIKVHDSLPTKRQLAHVNNAILELDKLANWKVSTNGSGNRAMVYFQQKKVTKKIVGK